MAYKMQGGVKNYLGNQKMVNAPLKWRSGPQHPSTELAYITKKEKDLLVNQDLHGSLKGGVNRGPSGIMSLNGWGSTDAGQNVSGAAASAAETGGGGARDRAQIQAEFSTGPSGPKLPPGVDPLTPQGALDFRAAAINAGAGQRVNPGFFDSRTRLSPNEIALAKAYRNDPNNRFAKRAYRNTGQGGFLNMLRSGGIFGNLLRGAGQKFGWGKKYDQPTSDMSQYNKLGLFAPSVNPDYYNDLDNEDILNTVGSIKSIAPLPVNMGYTGTQAIIPENAPAGIDESALNYLEGRGINFAQGGRAGYQGGELVEQETDFIQGPQGGEEFQETVVEGQEQPSREQLEALSMEIFQLPLEELDDQQLLVVYQEAMQGQPMEEAVQEDEVQFAAQGGLAGLL